MLAPPPLPLQELLAVKGISEQTAAKLHDAGAWPHARDGLRPRWHWNTPGGMRVHVCAG